MDFDEKQLKAHIKGGNFLPVYLIVGDEDYLKKYYTDLLMQKAVGKEFFDLNFEAFEGKGLDLKEVFEAAIVMPFMGDKRGITITDFKLESIGERDLSLIQDYLENPSQSTVIVFFQQSREFSLSKAKKAVDLIRKFGAVCSLNKRRGNDLIKPLISSAAKQGCTLSVQGANYLVSVVGDDFNVLINELNKVCNYTGQGEILREHIDAVAVKCDEAKIYDLTKFLFQKNFDKAYEILSVLLRQKTKPEFILGVIIGTYVDMYRAKVSLTCGSTAEALGEAYGYKSNTLFRLKNGARDASRMDIDTLRKCLDVLYSADCALKSTYENEASILEQLMVKLFLVQGGERV